MARTQAYVNLTGTTQVIRNLNKAVVGITDRSVTGMHEACATVIGASIAKTPVKKGDLRRSSYYEVTSNDRTGVVGEVGYTAAHAPYVHEIPKLNYTKPGTGWKFLERALQEKEDEVLRILRAATQVKEQDIVQNVFHGVTRASARRRVFGSEGSF